MMKRLVRLLVAFPLGVLLVALAISNRHGVSLILDPFRPETPALEITLPFYIYLLGMLLIGILIGGVTVWFGQSHWRRMAKHVKRDSVRWQSEASRLQREREDILSSQRQLEHRAA